MTIDEILTLREDALRMNLIGADRLLQFTPEALQNICNGIGADVFPDTIREALDKLHPTLRPVAMVHDVDYYLGLNSYEDFSFANDKFLLNGRIAARFKHKWYNPRRYIVRKQAKIFAELCQVCGWFAYLQAIKQRKEWSAK